MSKSRLASGRIKKVSGAELSADRREYLDLANAEPDLGLPPVDQSVLIGDTDGTRTWVDIDEFRGMSGFSGISGFSGQPGDPGGATGISGFSGFSGFSGIVGATGLPGDPGGATGVSGFSGFSGASGIVGATGLPGDPGGATGVSGFSGFSGFSGSTSLVINADGGTPSSIYGGISPINAGGVI